MSTERLNTIHIDLPCTPKFLNVVRLAVAGAAARAGLNTDEIDDLKTAISEACNNVIDHAFDEETIRSGEARIRITLVISDDAVRVEVEDEGKGFDPKRVSSSLEATTPPSKSLGLFLMRCMTDDLRVESAPGSGTRITFVKRRSR